MDYSYNTISFLNIYIKLEEAIKWFSVKNQIIPQGWVHIIPHLKY
jgi:hypothetical protein